MPETRGRLSRQEDADVFSAYRIRRRNLTGGVGNAGRVNSVAFVLEEGGDEGKITGTPFRWRGAALAGTPGTIGVGFGRGGVGTPRIGRVPNFGRSNAVAVGRENSSPSVGSGRGRSSGRRGGSSVLPYWYPRKPLQDITAVVRAIERRKAHRGGGEGLQSESPMLQDRANDSSGSTSAVQLEQDVSMITPHPTIRTKCCLPTNIGKVPKILLNITKSRNDLDSSSACLTPQKKLLENIDTVEKVVMEELRKLKRTPTAKKAVREKRVRTLMSMR